MNPGDKVTILGRTRTLVRPMPNIEGGWMISRPLEGFLFWRVDSMKVWRPVSKGLVPTAADIRGNAVVLNSQLKVPNFWQRCRDARCVVVPVPVYSKYGADGNTHQADFVGFRFAALRFDDEAVGPDYYIQIEEGQTGRDRLFGTAEEALAAYESRITRN